MSKIHSRLASGLAVAVIAAGLAAAQGIPGVGQPPAAPGATPAAPTADAPVQVTVEMLTNSANGYQIGYPTGWKVLTGSDGVDYAFLSPDESAFCIAASIVSADLAGVPDAKLKEAMSISQGEKFWTENYFGQFQNVKFLHVGATTEAPGGWPLQTVLATADITSESGVTSFAFAGIFTIKASTIYRTICYVPAAMYDATRPQFFAIFDSFKITK